MIKLSSAVLLTFLAGTSARIFTVRNNCPFTIWPAIFTDLNVGQSVPASPTGWMAPAYTQTSFSVPDEWKSGRIWGRQECDFSKSGPAACLSGGCNGGLQCDPHSGTGIPPATVAEWTLDAGGQDFYDVSLVDGFNLPVAVTNNVGCPVADCPVDLNPNCPHPLKGPVNQAGKTLGCFSACAANIDGNQGNSPNCCSGSFSTPQTCPPQGVKYYSYFKDACRNSYAYAYDESSNTALWTCPTKLKADYTITFCPYSRSQLLAFLNCSLSPSYVTQY